MQIRKNKIIVIAIAFVLLLSMTISLSSVNAATYPIPGTKDRYDDATYAAIQQGILLYN